jgi:hypothetical protein
LRGTSAFPDNTALSANRQRTPTDASTVSLRSIWKKNGLAIGSVGGAERDLFLATAERLEPWWAPAWTLQVLTGL